MSISIRLAGGNPACSEDIRNCAAASEQILIRQGIHWSRELRIALAMAACSLLQRLMPLLLVAMHLATSSFLFVVVMPGATSRF